MNPFKYKDAMLPIASLNSFILNGQKANDLFRPELLIRDLKMLCHTYQLSVDTDLLKPLLDHLVHHENDDVRRDTFELGWMYARRIADIIYALKYPTDQQKEENLRWKEEHWAYWREIKYLYLLGGLASSPYHEIFKQAILEKVKDLEVHVEQDSQDKALDGMLFRYPSGHYVVFDFGQSFIKRAYVIRRMGESIVKRKLQEVTASHLEAPKDDWLMKHAEDLNRFMIQTILDTLHEVSDTQCDVLISIANYVNQGELNPGKSSYGVLSVLSTNYESYLMEELSERLKRRVHVKLEHDATAMSHHVLQRPKTAVITLGTAFGIAFID